MKILSLILYFNVGCILQSFVAAEYYLKLSSNSPVVVGGTLNFKAELTKDDDPAIGSFRFKWDDNSLKHHSRQFDTTSPYDSWNVTYTDSPPGPYEVQVIVSGKIMFSWYEPITSQRLTFKLTDELNGNLDLLQQNKTQQNIVSNNLTVTHKISLKESDATYLKNSSTSILTYWFVDCEYHGVTNDFMFSRQYNQSDKKHHVEALVVAGYEPITTTTLPTTTTTSTTTTPKPTTSTTTSTTTPKPKSLVTNESIVHATKVKRDVNNIMDITTQLPHEFVIYNGSSAILSNKQFNPESPFICNGTVVPMSMNNTYGYFAKTFTVKAPVSNLAISGNNWIQQGNILELDISCKGSKPYMYCLNYFPGIYNITGNETCANPFSLVECKFGIKRYYSTPGSHTIVVVITNDIYKLITPITVTVYEVTKQAQLSVIVVPVTFSIVAIVLIVFGIAYHLQNRRRFTVEVADFNFGPQYADYMTFRERLRDSIMNAFTRATVNTEDGESGPIWPPNQKYGSMPRF